MTNTLRSAISFILLCAVYFSMLTPSGSGDFAFANENRMAQTATPKPRGLQFRLSEGTEGAEKRTVTPPTKANPLSENETTNLLKRLPAIKTDPEDQADFRKRAGSLPAPKPGKIIPARFPASESRTVPPTETLSRLDVLRYSPEGDLPIISDLNVTFSLPMVAVTSQEQAAQTVPVKLTPQPAGNWRWLGAKTLMFDTKPRFPMATKYTATIPAGTKSATGATLQKDVSWTFSTPPPKVEQMSPQNQVTTRNPLIFISFDQEINAEAVLRTTKVSSGGKIIPTRLATADEIASNASISYYAKSALPKRWLAFRAINADGSTANALPGATSISVVVDKGTPSAEGPLTTTAPQSFSFQTYGAFRFTQARCGWSGAKVCSPQEDWILQFTNQIDPESFDEKNFKIEPTLEGARIYPSGNYIYISGAKRGRTTYKISMGGTLKDVYGQTLENSVAATITTGTAERQFYAQGSAFVVLDPNAKPAYSFYSINHTSAKVKIYSAAPKDWNAFRDYMQWQHYEEGKRKPIPGKLVFDRTVSIENKSDELVETRIDLSSALDGGFGHAIVFIEPTWKRDKYDYTKITAWCEATQIGLDAFVDYEDLVGFATDLKTGKPLSGVELSIIPNGIGTTSGNVSDENPSRGWFDSLLGWFTKFGPNENLAETETVEQARSSTTDASGILRLPLADTQATTQNVLLARKGKDVAFLPENSDYYWQSYGSWHKRNPGSSDRWFVFDDRKMYRPKEEVSIKGYVRRVSNGKFGDVEGIPDSSSKLSYRLVDARGNEITKGEAQLNTFGAFDFKLKLTDAMNLGQAMVELRRNTSYAEYTHQFQVQEFRRPEFEVTAKVDSEAPHFVGGKADVSVEAKYFAGGGLANAEVNWTVNATPTNYTPPNRDDFTFGTWTPWWIFGGYGDGEISYGRGISQRNAESVQTFKAVTDASGKHRLKIDFDSVFPPRPYNISASASVQDVNRQTWSGNTALLVHPADLYVGIRTNRTFVNKGQSFDIETITTDLDGKAIPGRDVKVRATLKDWVYAKGAWKEQTVDEQTCSVKSSMDVSKCSFTAKQGGTYTITATVMDDRERENQSEITVWVSGGKIPPKRNVEQEQSMLIPSKKNFAPGEVAEILVMSPFAPAEGVLTLRRDGLVKTERFTMKDSTAVLKIPIEEKYLPNIFAQVDLVGAAERLAETKADEGKPLPKRPAFATGQLNLSVKIKSRELTVSAEPQTKNLEPGGETNVEIQVEDFRGEPVGNTEVAVVVVDESVLSLTGYRIANPLATFYTDRGAGVSDYHSRKDVLLANAKDLVALRTDRRIEFGAWEISAGAVSNTAVNGRRVMEMSAPPATEKMKTDSFREENQQAQQQPNINLRTNFEALANWSPSVKTDSSGRASVAIKLPDSLTRYRVMAVAVDNAKRFGLGESNITARQPLMVRPSAPRFMNFGDKVELPVVVQNQTDNAMTVDVAVRATNAKLGVSRGVSGSVSSPTVKEGASADSFMGKRIVVPANDRVEVRFPVSAEKAGTARFQFGVSSGKYSDAQEISLPVWTPATTEAFATYGSIDESGSIAQPVDAPKDVFPQFGGMEVTTSSTQLQELTDSFIYLYRYKFECSEQISSRMISVAALRDVLSAFKAKEMPSAEELEKSFAKDIEILKGRQRDDGSFGLWSKRRERYEYPFLTIHVAHALALAKTKGYKVPDEMLDKTKPYLKNVEKYFNDEWYKNYPEVRWTISAYALYIRNLMGDRDAAKAKALLKEATLQKLPFEATGWILSVLADDKNSPAEVQTIIRFLMNRTTETAAAANFITDYRDGAFLIMASNRRADGVLLEALIKTEGGNASVSERASGGQLSASDLIPKLVRGLLAHRTEGRWQNTQENVFILLALDKYFNTYEKVTPDFVARAWLGNVYAGEQKFKGRSTDFNRFDVPMSYLLEQSGAANLLLDKQGAGRLYYRIGMKYAPKNLKLAPADYGFTVMRKYEAVDDVSDVKQNADGTWTIKSGARIRVRLTMVADSRRYHVALVDPLPAGLEILNPELAVTEVIPADKGEGNTPVLSYGSRSFGRGWWYWRWQWFEHQNFRDERAEAFSSLLWEGVYNYTYVARATTPGEFVVPPAKAEEMYNPETFGRTGTDFVKVE